MRIKTCIFSVFLCLGFMGQMAQAADPQRGQQQYRKCIACHFVDRPNNKIGPSLQNIMGRPAGEVPGFNYSAAMKKAGQEGLIWTDETMLTYLHAPRKMIPGSRMINVPNLKDQDMRDIIAYLQLLTDSAKADSDAEDTETAD